MLIAIAHRFYSCLIELSIGIGQSPRRGLSFQVAAMDMLEKIKKANPDIELPIYGMIPGCRISPKVCRHLELIARRQGLPLPVYQSLPTDKSGEQPMQGVVCTIGELEFIGLLILLNFGRRTMMMILRSWLCWCSFFCSYNLNL